MVNLRSFFEPKSIAIIGASDHEEKVGGILFLNALKSSAKIFPINPSHDELRGLKCYKSVLDIREAVDLAVIAIPAAFVSKAMEECGKKGIKSVIMISAGFSEVGNIKGAEENLKIAKKYGMRFTGGNCFGVCNPYENLDLTFAKNSPKKGGIAFISQSGALWSFASDLSLSEGFGFSGFVGLGNMENMDFNDFIEYFAEDKKTRRIALYIEQVKDGKRFIEVCQKAVKNGKEIYAVKGGSSVAGEQAAVSHTASLASDYAIYKGAFKQAGVVQFDSFLDLFGGIKVKKKNIKLGKSAFILTNAGGAGVLLSDYLSRKGVKIVEKSLDILGAASAEDYKKHFEEIKSKSFESLFVIVTPQSMSEMEKTAEKIVEMKKELKDKNVVAVFLGGESMKEANKIFENNGVEFVNRIEEI